ncbi:MAG TPA: hypothetical protein VGO80_04005 [Solirubrobacteraceae bacterium]|jgi:hypothetical protein|nr:hypothetical protein [Solirubrobacteraceae bacterium]
MRGVALTLWMGFTSPRMPYRPVFDSSEPLEVVEIPLTLEHCHALGVRSGADAARRRTFNEAGARVCAADRTFQAFEAHGGRGMDSFLRVVRTPPSQSVLDRPGPSASPRSAHAHGRRVAAVRHSGVLEPLARPAARTAIRRVLRQQT